MSGCRATALAVAHRGASGRLPENSMEAFEEAVRAGTDAIEFDVRLSADERLVVIHDETLLRTHGRPEHVATLRSADLRAAGLPMIEEVVDAFGGAAILDIEVKTYGKRAVLALAHALRGRLLREGSIITSFDRPTAEIAASARLPVGLLFSRPLGDEVDLARHLGARTLVAKKTVATPDLVARAHAEGIGVWAWTVDEEAEIEALLAAGLDGLCSNFPERVIAALDRLT